MALALCAANWLIPGLGYILSRDMARGATLFILINLCFAIGILMGGYILAPVSWAPFTPNFNLVGILTYLSQAFHGGGWLGLQGLQRAAASDTSAYFNLTALGSKPYADLGAFHLVVAGGLNYFATVRLWDLLAGNPQLSQAPAPGAEVAT